MKLLVSFAGLGMVLLFGSRSFAQDKVNWDFSYNSKDQSLLFTARMDEGWHIYSMTTDPSSGPVPTSFHFEKSKKVKLSGSVAEPVPTQEYDPNFEADVAFFEKQVTFAQKIKFKKAGKVQGHVTYMTCNATMCLPPIDVEFSITIN